MKQEKIRYDLAFSMGAGCASALALRAAKMQFASYPFDWAGGGSVIGNAQIVADGFEDWMRMEDLELTDVLHATFNASIYRSRRTGITFSHDFPAGCYLEDEFPSVAEKYGRRIKRLFGEIDKARRILVVYNEIPYRHVAAESDVIRAQRILQARFPDKRIDLLYFAQDPDCKDREPRALNENVTVILLNYHTIVRGYVCAAAFFYKMILHLRDHYNVPDVRTPEQIAKIKAIEAERERLRWGTGLTKWINTRLYHLYRHLERLLAKRGCVPDSERPPKLYRERGERRRSLAEPDISFLPRDEEAIRRAYALLG